MATNLTTQSNQTQARNPIEGWLTFSTGDIPVVDTRWIQLTVTPPPGVKFPDNPQMVLAQVRDPSNQNQTNQYPDSFAVTVAEVVPDFLIFKIARADQPANSEGAHIRIDFLVVP